MLLFRVRGGFRDRDVVGDGFRVRVKDRWNWVLCIYMYSFTK